MSHFVDELPKYPDATDDNEPTLLSLADVRGAATVEDCGRGWLAHRQGDGHWLEFAVLDRVCDEGGATLVSAVWRGEGPGGVDHPLREMRHSYFGRDGYLYCAPLDLFAAAVPMLKRWFD